VEGAKTSEGELEVVRGKMGEGGDEEEEEVVEKKRPAIRFILGARRRDRKSFSNPTFLRSTGRRVETGGAGDARNSAEEEGDLGRSKVGGRKVQDARSSPRAHPSLKLKRRRRESAK
jgi:hypothetical protein